MREGEGKLKVGGGSFDPFHAREKGLKVVMAGVKGVGERSLKMEDTNDVEVLPY